LGDLAHLAQTCRGDRAPGAHYIEELRLVEFPCLSRVRDEHDVQRAILAPQARCHPEEKGLGQLPVAIGHAAGDVQQEEYCRASGGLAAARELPIAQVFIDERGCFGVEGAPLRRLAHRAAPIQAGTRTAPVPALTPPVRFLTGARARLQIGQPEIFPEPVDDVVYLELEHQLDATALGTSGALLPGRALVARLAQHIAWLGSTLPDARALPCATQPEAIVLEHAHRHARCGRR